MTDENKRALVIIATFVIAAWVLSMWMKPANAEPVNSPDDGFYAPYYWPNGINPSDGNMYGQPNAFNSTINVYAQNPALGQLANDYIPIFGLVGMTAVGAQ